MNFNSPVRVRFAPSPTGHMHLGSARTALYDYLIARKTGGQFILRIEDTDQKRFVPGAEEELISGLRWLGLDWDEGPDIGGPYGSYRQSERKNIYQDHALELIKRGHAYYCFCTPERLASVRLEQQKQKENVHYDGTCRNIPLTIAMDRVSSGERYVIRFKTPLDGKTEVRDVLRGEIVVENKNLDDYILVKSDGLALYHLAHVVDDHIMKITHVIRGSEWLPTLPLHGLIHRSFGWEEPEFIHLSVFLKPSGKGKMSKRETSDLLKDGHSIYVKDLKDLGYLPEAVINWIALMGWSYDDHTEFFTLNDLIEKFGLDRLNPSPAAINFSKFDHFNGLHIRNLSKEELGKRLLPVYQRAGYNADAETAIKIAPIIQERLTTLEDAPEISGFLFMDEVEITPADLVPKGLTPSESACIARRVLEIIEKLPGVEVKIVEPPLRSLVEELGVSAGQVFGILRSAITGQKVSPPLFECIEIIGKQKVVKRVKTAIEFLENMR